MTALNEADDGLEQTAPVWAVFGDLMSGLLGAFVLILVGVLVVQLDLMANLQAEVEKRRVVLAEPLKQLGEFDVPVKIHREVTATVKVKVVPLEGQAAPAPAPAAEPSEPQ